MDGRVGGFRDLLKLITTVTAIAVGRLVFGATLAEPADAEH
ncbi:hypothetical protein ACFYW8_13510 [Streptomyces sp. NPDC002742]